MNNFLHNSSQYTHFRPQYPEMLFKYLKKVVASNNFALDCGAGSGQGTSGLSQYFKKVIATDLSFDLLLKAPKIPNVSYAQASAEKLPICSNSMDIICVAQAIHWFKFDEFYEEVRRILKPKGVIAAWGYNQTTIEPVVDEVINKLYQKMTDSQNASRERQYLYDQYKTIPFPFATIIAPNFKIEMNWNLFQLLGYISTWPGLLEYQRRFHINLLSEINDTLFSAWGDPLMAKKITWTIYLLLGRMT